METYVEERLARTLIQKYLEELINTSGEIFYQLLPEDLVSQSVDMGEGVLSSTGALVINTGEFTGRSPRDRFIVKEDRSGKMIDWNEINQSIEEKYFNGLFKKMMEYVKDKKL